MTNANHFPKNELSALERARLRAVGARAELLGKEGGALSAEELAELLGVARATVYRWRRDGRLLAVPLGRRTVFPAWQVEGGRLLTGFSDVLRELESGARDPVAKVLVLLSHSRALGGASPLELLRRGDTESVERVRNFAANLGR